jgi:hypothetical protein
MKIQVNVSKEDQEQIKEMTRIVDGQIDMQDVYDKAFSIGIENFVTGILAAVNEPEE